MKRPIALLCAFAVLLAAFLPASALAGKKKKTWYQYAVPFTCGTNATDPGRTLMGDHATVIHAMNTGTADATLYLGLALTYPSGSLLPGWVSERVEVTLAAGVASQASCQDVLDLQNQVPPPPFPLPAYAQGFALVQSSVALDVQSSHAVEMAGGQVALTSQAVQPRRIVPPPAP